MPLEPTSIAVGKGLAVAEKGVEEIAKVATKIDDVLRGSYKILSQEITVLCPEQIETVSIAFEASGGVIGKKIRLPFGKPLRARLRPLRSGENIADNSLLMTRDGFEIDTKGMAGSDLFLLDVEYQIRTPDFVDALVQRNVAREVPKDKEREYWMHAELKHPKVLRTRVGKLDLRDLPFDVDVAVSSDIKMVIPQTFKREIEIGAQVLAEREPHRKALLARAHAAAMRSRGTGRDIATMLGDLQELFIPSTFSRFVDVQRDFRYSECMRGISFYDTLPFPTWPKNVTVVSRTDLNLEKCASEGILVYKKAAFLESVAKVFGIHLD
jgi:hypothetical protein